MASRRKTAYTFQAHSGHPATDSQPVADPGPYETVDPVTPQPHVTDTPARGSAGGVLASPLTWLGLAALLAGVEFATPSTLLIPIFFPLPAVLAAWHRSRWWVVALVVGMTAVALAHDLTAADTWGVGPPWVNAAVRLAAYSLFVLLTAHAARLRDELTDPDATPSYPSRPFPVAVSSPVFWVALAVVLAGVDYWTGPEVLVSVLYIIPVLLAGWHRRLAWAVGIGACLILGRLVLELTSRGAWLLWADLLNAAFRLLMLGVVAYIADLSAFLTLEAADRVGDEEGHSVETVIDPDALRAVTPAEGLQPAERLPGRPRSRLGVVYEVVATVGIGATVAWDAFQSLATSGRGERTAPNAREKTPGDRSD